MSAEAIAAIFTGLTGLVAALAAFTANRSRQVAVEQRTLRRRVRKLERQIVALVEHSFVLELELARNGLRVPDRPALLEDLDADEDEPPPQSGRDIDPGSPARHRA